MNNEQFVYWLSGYLTGINMTPWLRRQLQPVIDVLKTVKSKESIPLEFVHFTPEED